MPEATLDVGEAEEEAVEINVDPEAKKILSETVPDKAIDVVETQEEKKDELEDYSTGVKSRIDKLTKRMREEERQKQSAVEFAENVRKENENLKTFMADKTKLSDLELDDTQRTALMLAVKPALSGGNIGEFYGVFKDKIEDGINKGNKTISLGPVDLGQFASGRFGTAKVTNLYWDTRSNSFVYN